MTLVEFLDACLAKDEADAELVIWPYGEGNTAQPNDTWPDYREWMRVHGWSSDEAPHLARWSPARVLAEVEAKRRILKLHSPDGWNQNLCAVCGCPDESPEPFPCPTLRAVAQPYADRLGWDESWRLS